MQTAPPRGETTKAPAPAMPKRRPDWLMDLGRGAIAMAKLIEHGLFPFAGRIPFLPWRKRRFATRFRTCLEDLGLTYLKLGQFLALRYDILPAEVCEELNNLFESIPPMPPGVAESIIERELGAPLETLYQSFEPVPLAAASVGQVHRARLPNGDPVAVKVQRQGIEPIFLADIRNLKRLVRVIQKMGLVGRLDAVGMIDQFALWTTREMDFRVEAHTAQRVADNSGPTVVIPGIYWDLSRRRVLTMDFVEGISATTVCKLADENHTDALKTRLTGFDLDTALHNFADASLSQLFTHGFFHGDPHPGNILFLSDNKICFLDFGIFGSITDEERANVTGQIESLATGNVGASLRYYSQQVIETADTDYDKFRAECGDVLKRWYRALSDPNSPIEDRHLSRYTGEMIDVSRKNNLIYDLNYLLFWRALNNLNATLWHVKPDYDLIGQLRDFFQRERPSTTDRALEVLLDPSWQADLFRAGSRLRSWADVGPRETTRRAKPMNASHIDSHKRRRRVTVETTVVALAVLAVAAGTLIAAPPLPAPWHWLPLLFSSLAPILAYRWFR